MSETWKKFAFAHAKKCYPKECCGMLIKKEDNIIYGPCNNLAKDEEELSFVIDPDDWANYEDQGEVIGIVHSHPVGVLQFSEQDIASCNHLDVDFYLVCPESEQIITIQPKN